MTISRWNTKQQATWVQIVERIDSVELARLDAFADAFSRLRVLDDALAQLALTAFCDADIAADCMARHRFGPSGATAYGLLARGQRERVVEWLREYAADNRKVVVDPNRRCSRPAE